MIPGENAAKCGAPRTGLSPFLAREKNTTDQSHKQDSLVICSIVTTALRYSSLDHN